MSCRGHVLREVQLSQAVFFALFLAQNGGGGRQDNSFLKFCPLILTPLPFACSLARWLFNAIAGYSAGDG